MENFQKKIISATILSVFIFSFVYVQNTHAQVGGVVTDPGVTANTAKLVQTSASEDVKITKDTWKDVVKKILQSLAKRVLAELTKETVNWINNGFEGKPLFVQDPQGFLTDISNSQIKLLVNTVGYDPIKYPFGRGLAIGLIQGTKDYFAQAAQFSLDQAIGGSQNRVEFYGNFAIGGWDAYAQLALPNNNFYGSQIITNNYGAKITADLQLNPGELLKGEISQAKGFLTPKKCTQYKNPDGSITETPTVTFLTVPQKNIFMTLKEVFGVKKAYAQQYGQYDSNIYGTNRNISLPGEQPTTFENDGNGPTGTVDPNSGGQTGTQIDLSKPATKSYCIRSEVTTPGGLVTDQISLALGSKFRQNELGQALGNSVSAVFDALLNKLIQDGLSSLGNTSSTQAQDNFSYEGYSFGVNNGQSTQGDNGWVGADEIIDVQKFKNDLNGYTQTINGTTVSVPGGIARTQEYIDIQTRILADVRSLPAKYQKLDQCLPGPDRFWESRLDKEVRRESKKLEKKAESKNAKKSQKAIRAIRALEYSVDYFKNWVQIKIIGTLPSATLILDEMKNFKNNDERVKNIVDDTFKKKTVKARLEAIKTFVDPLPTVNPNTPGSGTLTAAEELVAKTQYGKYKAIQGQIVNEDVLNEIRAEEDTLDQDIKRITDLTNQCLSERTSNGWGAPDSKGKGNGEFIGGGLLSSTDGRTGVVTQYYATEKQHFCGWPIVDGYSYGDASDGEISDLSQAVRTVNGVAQEDPSSPNRLLSALNNVIDLIADDKDEGDDADGTGVAYNPNDRFTYILVGSHIEGQPKPDGSLGYDIPIVNAKHVYKRFLSNVNIDVSCDFVFPSTILDYQKDVSGGSF